MMKRILNDASALVLAGGNSSRMGTDKVLLALDGRTMLRRAVDFWREFVPAVYVAPGTREHLSILPAPAVYDSYPGCGPLAGLEAGLSVLSEDRALLFISGVDMPYLSQEAALLLHGSMLNHDAAVFRKDGQREPLFGLYRKTCLPMARAMLDSGEYRLGLLLDRVDTLVLDWPEEKLFRNLNTPEDYRQALMDTE